MKSWLARQRYLVDYTLAAMARRKAQNLGMLAVFSLIVFLVGSMSLMASALRQEAAQVLAGAPEIVLQKMSAGRHELVPAEWRQRIGRMRGVHDIRMRLWGYYFDPVVSANYTVQVPATEAPAPGAVVLGAGIARLRGLAVGDSLVLRAYDGALKHFSIAGVLPAESELVDADLVLVDEAGFRELFAFPADAYTDITLAVANPQEVGNVVAQLAKRFPEGRVIRRDEILRTYQSVFDWREGVALALALPALLAFLILAWVRAAGLSADERREIGILKAIGWETRDVLQMKLWEGVLIAATAYSLGILAAWWHVFHFGAGLFAPVLMGWSTLYPRFDLVPAVDGLVLLALGFFTVLPYALAVVVPAWRAASVDPDAVLRS